MKRGDSGKTIDEQCIDCGVCSTHCRYLQQFGSPKQQIQTWKETTEQGTSFLCNLCGLCSAVCPLQLNPADMFFELRVASQGMRARAFRQHTPLRLYEKAGMSPMLSWYGLPARCTAVYFPGCSFSGMRPQKVIQAYEELVKQDPALGIVLDCCLKPSHDLGSWSTKEKYFDQMMASLIEKRVRRVIVNCPSCFSMFDKYGHEIEVVTIYDVLAGSALDGDKSQLKQVTVHDPCRMRACLSAQQSVRILLNSLGIEVEEMKNHGRLTLCCGEGGGVGYLNQELAESWADKRVAQAGEYPIVTYCSGCVAQLQSKATVHHILDLLFTSDKYAQLFSASSGSLYRYIDRWRLKQALKKIIQPEQSGARNFQGKVIF